MIIQNMLLIIVNMYDNTNLGNNNDIIIIDCGNAKGDGECYY